MSLRMQKLQNLHCSEITTINTSLQTSRIGLTECRNLGLQPLHLKTLEYRRSNTSSSNIISLRTLKQATEEVVVTDFPGLVILEMYSNIKEIFLVQIHLYVT